MPAFILITALVIVTCYSILITVFFAGWLRTKNYQPGTQPPVTRVSVLIPCRNEEGNIDDLFRDLNSQDYPGGLIQIIWIDDHSTDRTAAKLKELIGNRSNNSLVSLTGSKSGKKAALKAGMEIAAGELILLTDADSRHTSRWALTLAKFFEDSGSDLILGPVLIAPADTGFKQVQKLEYLSLVASSVGAAGCGRPIMAQGPNIAVRADDYRRMVNNLEEKFASGDDVFLLQSMLRSPGKKVQFLLNQDAIVSAKPAASLSQFLHQRQRWASKASGYRNWFMILTTLLIFIANLSILAALIMALSGKVPLTLFLMLFGIKTVADLPLLAAATKFFRCTSLLWWFLPVQLLYPVYIVSAGILSQIRPVRWK